MLLSAAEKFCPLLMKYAVGVKLIPAFQYLNTLKSALATLSGIKSESPEFSFKN